MGWEIDVWTNKADSVRNIKLRNAAGDVLEITIDQYTGKIENAIIFDNPYANEINNGWNCKG